MFSWWEPFFEFGFYVFCGCVVLSALVFSCMLGVLAALKCFGMI